MELLQVTALRTILCHHHLNALHRRARRAIGDATSHCTRAFGKTDVGNVVADDCTVRTLVLHSYTVVVIDTWQGCLVGIEQILLGARHTCQSLPRLAFLFGAAALHDVGLDQNRALLIDAPRQFHRAFVHALRGIKAVEQCAVADGLRVDIIGVEHHVIDDALYAIGQRSAGIQRLLSIGHTCFRVNLVLSVGVLVGGTMLPTEAGLHVRSLERVDGILLAAHIDTELVAEALCIAVGRPGEHDAVVQLLHQEIVHWHSTDGAHRHRGLRIVAFCVLVPELRHVIDIVGRRRLVGKSGIGVCMHAMIKCGYLHAIAIDHPIVVAVVARNVIHVPRQVHFLVALIEHGIQVAGLGDGRVDGDGLTDDLAVVGKGDAVDRGTVKISLHLVVAHVGSLRYCA